MFNVIKIAELITLMTKNRFMTSRVNRCVVASPSTGGLDGTVMLLRRDLDDGNADDAVAVVGIVGDKFRRFNGSGGVFEWLC